nr:ABC-three component system middle component 5 [uncultured Bacteroides sp.]
MIIYNQAFDLYHCIYRILNFLNRFNAGDIIEIDKLRIWDFYFLFPNKVYDIKLKQEEKDIRVLRKQFIKRTTNPYEMIFEDRKIFEKLKPYQLSALNCIASYGIVNKEMLAQQRISIEDKELLNIYISRFEELSPKEKNVISLMTSHFYNMSLFGQYGLKSRTNLMESKYDAE